MPIKVASEIAPLKRVMLHRPGAELEHLAPRVLERLLFDDIPFLRSAQKEHDDFADILRTHGVEVVYLEDLMTDVLRSSEERKQRFVTQFIAEGGAAAQRYREPLKDFLLGISDEKELVLKTMSGVSLKELRTDRSSPLVDLLQPESRFLLEPIPNLYFTRDPFAVIGRSVSLHHMYSATRQRETIYGEYILAFHPDMQTERQLCYHREDPFSIEGGDLLNLSEHVLGVGISQRTTPEAIELLAQNLFTDEASAIDTLLAFDIPGIRAFMHLDTVITQVDRDKFVIHPGILGSLRVFRITPGKNGGLLAEELSDSLEQILAEHLGLDRAILIKCGGNDRIASEREQWNDGSNTLCISPGTVIAYDRNYVTNSVLDKNGIEVLELPSSELSRGRGGPRCMSMPLLRDSSCF